MNKKQILFVFVPCILIALLLLASFVYEIGFENRAKPLMIKYDENGELAGRAPFPPSLLQPFGTDRNGNDLGLRLLEGAKYTILFAIGAAILRTLAGVITGSFFSFTENLTIIGETLFYPLSIHPFIHFSLCPDLANGTYKG